MKPRRIFTQITLCAALAGLVVWPAWADWGPPLGNGANAYPVEGGYAPPMMPSGNSDLGCADAYGYGPPPMNYLPMDGGAYAGGPCDPNLMGSGGCGQGLGGLASGCRPVGLLGRLGSMTGLAGCGTGGGGGGRGGGGGFQSHRDGYGRGAYPLPFVPHQQVVNPYESFPGINPMGEYVNLGDVCCGPHWYDVMVEAVFLQRDRDSNVNLSSEGPRGLGQPNVVLSTSALDTGLNTGLRAAGRLQMNAVDSIEAVYLGGIDWSDTQTVLSNNNDLYSVYSDFGVDPLGGFEDTDQAARHSATLNSDLDSLEINCRRDWIGKHYKTSGALLLGCRYVHLRDRFQFATLVNQHIDAVTDPNNPVLFGPGASLYNVLAQNNMLGVQLGGELVFCVLPGLTVGTEGKIGVFGNRANQQTNFNATTGMVDLTESRSATIATYGSELQAFFLWQFHPLAKVRGGYEALFLSNLATGPSNFNPQDVFTARLPMLATGDDLLFHGFHVGLELGW